MPRGKDGKKTSGSQAVPDCCDLCCDSLDDGQDILNAKETAAAIFTATVRE